MNFCSLGSTNVLWVHMRDLYNQNETIHIHSEDCHRQSYYQILLVYSNNTPSSNDCLVHFLCCLHLYHTECEGEYSPGRMIAVLVSLIEMLTVSTNALNTDPIGCPTNEVSVRSLTNSHLALNLIKVIMSAR